MNRHSPQLILLLLFVLTARTSLQAQPSIQWSKCYGDSTNQTLVGVTEAYGTGYILAGFTDSCVHGQLDYFIVKIDDTGKELWTKCYGGSFADVAQDVIKVRGETPADDGYLVIGYAQSNDGDITGSKGSGDYWVIKTDMNGNMQWQKSYGGSGGDEARTAVQTADGGIVIAGTTYSNDGDISGNHGNLDYWLVKISPSGSLLWQKTLGGSYDDMMGRSECLAPTQDGGVAVVGSSYSPDGDVTSPIGLADVWAVKLDASGNIQWQKSYGGYGVDWGQSIMQTADSGYLVSGQMVDYPTASQWHSLIKTDKSGSIQWTAPPGKGYKSIRMTGSGGYIAIADTNVVDCTIRSIDSAGGLLWQKTIGGSGTDYGRHILRTNDGGYIVAGSTDSNDGDVSGNHGGNDFWVVKFAPDPTAVEDVVAHKAISYYPNPTNGMVRFPEPVHVRLVNLLGQTICQDKQTTSVDLSLQPSGVYILQFYDREGRELQRSKLVKQ